jgi:pyruvate dehydrogenase E2 component (dihydrolipoamide acetyltransferase)
VAFEFRLPDLGEGIQEAQLLAWRVAPGQQVAAFQPLCEVESAKAAVELTAPVAGRVLERRFAEGDLAHIGDVLVVLDTDAHAVPAPTASNASLPTHLTPASADEDWFGIVGTPPTAAARPSRDPDRVRAAPIVRRLARERGINLEEIAGSGPQGRVRLADLDVRQVAAVVGEPDTPLVREPRTVLLRGLRKSIADHMLAAWQHAPQVTAMDLLDVTGLVAARQALVASADAEHVRLTYLPFFIKAAIEALRAVPEANAVVDERQQAIVLRPEYHLGVATAVPGGLVVPVVRHADKLSLLELARETDRVVTAARDGRGAPADQTGSTFTITSFGGLPGGPLFATPILNYPEVAILGLGRIDLQPRVMDGQVVARQCLGASFTFDHRVLDGEAAGRFMSVFRRFLEQPLEFLLRLR